MKSYLPPSIFEVGTVEDPIRIGSFIEGHNGLAVRDLQKRVVGNDGFERLLDGLGWMLRSAEIRDGPLAWEVEILMIVR